jgi:hypothetical protein
MKLDVDNKQRIKSGFTFILEFYKVLMGSFITLFVPHQCGDHICSISEIMSTKDEYRSFVLFVNFVSCFLLMCLYFIELKRENWCITYLDINAEKPNNNLDSEIEEYPEIKKQMTKINTNYKKFSLVCVICQGFNIIVSVADLAMHWPGSVSLSPLIGYVILMLSKLYNTHFISVASLKEERAYSAYLSISKTYNTIDADHKNTEIYQV